MDTQAQEVVLPWNLIELDSGDHVYIMDGDDIQVVRFHKTQSEVAKRVVACVNACRGINTEELLTSDFGEDSVEVGTLLGQTMQQRDELLEVLKSIVKSLADQDEEGLIAHAQQMIDARAAIAKATGHGISDSEGGHCD